MNSMSTAGVEVDSRSADGALSRGSASGGVRSALPSPGYAAYRSGLRRTSLLVRLGQLVLVVVFLVLWEVAPRAHWIDPMLTSYPSAIARTAVGLVQDGSLARNAWATFNATLVGFVGGMLLGTAVATLLWLSPFLFRVLDPFIVVVNALPKIALVPVFYIWLGDRASIYAMAIAVSVFVTILMLYTGFRAVDPDKLRLARMYGASRLRTHWMIVLPGSVPTMIATLKVNIGLALVGVVVGEFQSAKAGLGYLISYGGQVFQMNLVMTAIVALAAISCVLFGGVQVLEAAILRRRGAGGNDVD
jgi:NitT/TauT family transport system permease protein